MDADLDIVTTLYEGLSYPINSITGFYSWCNSYADPRNHDWFLMGSPFPTLAIVAVYLTFVKYGPIYMKDRKPLDLRWPLIIYNTGITGLNGWMAYELLHCGLQRNYNFSCQLVDTSLNEYDVRIAKALWWYYFSKCLEFMDTFFFIVRKKHTQLTFLHIYHHSTMFAFWWVGAKFVPGGCALTGAMVNCFVHVIMYSYYALAAIGPLVRRYLWWKKYLTILQLIQFTIGVVFGLNAIITGCQFTRWMQYVFVCYAFSFIILFSNFYQNAYIVKDKEPIDSKSTPKVEKRKKRVPQKVTKKAHLGDPRSGHSRSERKKED